MSGHCPKELAASKMGPLNHSQWVTMALRVLMFYMTFENPPEAIQKLAEFKLKHYCVNWFKLRVR